MFKEAKRTIMRGLSVAMVGMMCVGLLPSMAQAETTVDHTQLNALIQKAKDLDVTSYAEETTDYFQAAITAAEVTDANAQATQSEVDKQTQLLVDTSKALVGKTNPNTLYPGDYTVDAKILQESSDSASMSDEALESHSLQLHVDEKGTATLRMAFKSVHYLGQEGYMGEFSYFDSYHEDFPNPIRKGYTAIPATVLSRYDFVDGYNDPVNGTDSTMKGKKYIHEVEIPIDVSQSQFWIQVYVPVMESISEGGGTKQARLNLDWSTRKQTAGLTTDKTALKAAVTELNTLKSTLTESDYSTQNWALLDAGITAGNYIADNMNVNQSMVDAMITAINSMKKIFTEDAVPVDKKPLKTAIDAAKAYLTETDKYTENSLQALKQVIQTAEAVYADDNADQTAVTAQCENLERAVQALKEKDNSGNNTIDVKNLADGVYAVTGKMVKIDKESASMSNEAINHTIKLTVQNGKYLVTMDFKGLKINSKFGYLSKLKYFKNGYTLNRFGSPQGDLGETTVLSYQKDSSGALASDQYGTNYPDKVQFELIPEALEDGYAPLQVFVPVMEAIAAGTGTQPVFLHLDWSTIRATTDDDAAFTDNDNNNNGNDNNDDNGNNNNNNWINGGLNQDGLNAGGLSQGSGLSSGSLSSGGLDGGSGLGGSTGLSALSDGAKTGDTSQTSLWFALVCGAAAAALFLGSKAGRKPERS